MQKLHVLFMEHNKNHYKSFCLNLEQIMQPEYELSFEPVDDPVAAISILKKHSDDYQMFVADLLFPDDIQHEVQPAKQVPIGLQAVREAAKHPHIVRVALSAGERDHPGITSDFNEAGGDIYLDKDAIKENRIKEEVVRSQLYTLLEQRGYAKIAPLEYKPDPDNPGLEAVIEQIGEETLRNLLRQIVPSCSSFTPQYVAPGFSGAAVLRVQGRGCKGNATTTDLLIKLSRDQDKIESELKRQPVPGSPGDELYVHSLFNQTFRSGGWFASAWSFRYNAMTLLQWLSKPDTSLVSVNHILDELFLQGLAMQYREGEIKEISALLSLFPNLPGRARIIEQLPILTELIARVLPDINFSPLVINRLLTDQMIGNEPERRIVSPVYECLSHGDLHTRNILVTSKAGRPYLIDPARRSKRHWASDVARLSADLWITAWHEGANSYLWDELSAWRADVNHWVATGITSAPNAASQNTASALSWIHTNMEAVFQEVHKPLPKWEFDLALAMEFLRLSTYSDIPAPKRCLGIVAAFDILTSMAREQPWQPR